MATATKDVDLKLSDTQNSHFIECSASSKSCANVKSEGDSRTAWSRACSTLDKDECLTKKTQYKYCISMKLTILFDFVIKQKIII